MGPPSKSQTRGLTSSKGGSGGRWRTPHQQAKMSDRVEMGKTLEVGDQGIWVTFARGMKSKAIREITELCEEVRRPTRAMSRPRHPGTNQLFQVRRVHVWTPKAIGHQSGPRSRGRRGWA